MPVRKNIDNQNESLKASLDKMSEKNSDGANTNMFANIAQKQASNNNS